MNDIIKYQNETKYLRLELIRALNKKLKTNSEGYKICSDYFTGYIELYCKGKSDIDGKDKEITITVPIPTCLAVKDFRDVVETRYIKDSANTGVWLGINTLKLIKLLDKGKMYDGIEIQLGGSVRSDKGVDSYIDAFIDMQMATYLAGVSNKNGLINLMNIFRSLLTGKAKPNYANDSGGSNGINGKKIIRYVDINSVDISDIANLGIYSLLFTSFYKNIAIKRIGKDFLDFIGRFRKKKIGVGELDNAYFCTDIEDFIPYVLINYENDEIYTFIGNRGYCNNLKGNSDDLNKIADTVRNSANPLELYMVMKQRYGNNITVSK